MGRRGGNKREAHPTIQGKVKLRVFMAFTRSYHSPHPDVAIKR